MINLDIENSGNLLNVLKAYRDDYSEIANIAPAPLVNHLLVEFFRHGEFNPNDYQRLLEYINRHNLLNNELTDFKRNDIALLVENQPGNYYSIFTISYNSENQQLNVYSKFREDGIRANDGEEPLHNTYQLNLD